MRALPRPISLLLLLLVGLSGCVAAGPYYEPSTLPALAAGQARLVLFRQSGFIGMATTIPVAVDAQGVADLPQDGYVSLDLPAGRHEISAANWMGTARLVLDLAPGALAYVEADWTPLAGNLFASPPPSAPGAVELVDEGPYRLTLVDPAAAQQALAAARQP